MKRAQVVAALAVLSLGIFAWWQSGQMAYREHGSPGPGFAPRWLGTFLAVTGLLLLAGALVARERCSFLPERNVVSRISVLYFGSVAWVTLIPLLGMMLAVTGIMTWGAWYLGVRRGRSLCQVGIGIPLVLYLVFRVWLGVPWPQGLLGI